MKSSDVIKTAARYWPALERAAGLKRNVRYQVAKRHLRGIGLEIGALHGPLPMPRGAKVFYLDRLLPRELRVHYPELEKHEFFVSVVSDGEQLACIADGSLDFLVANHMIEHCEDPIRTLISFHSKLRIGGRIFLAVPDMRHTFDHERAKTRWDHLLADHERGPEVSRTAHYLEWAEKIDGCAGEEIARRAADLEQRRVNIHFHCWDQQDFSAVLTEMQRYISFAVRETQTRKDESIFILERTA